MGATAAPTDELAWIRQRPEGFRALKPCCWLRCVEKVMLGIEEAETRIEAVRGKFERQLARLRERERLVAISRQDCQKEEEALQRDRARHREAQEKVRGVRR